MEIPANKSHPRIFSKLAIMLLASFVIFACYELWLSLSSPPTFAKQNQIGVVFQGAMVNHVTGYGMLKPKSAVSLIANVQGAVRTINLKPGANVSKQDVIIELVNPELQRQLEDAELGLLESQSELEKLKIKLQRQSRSLNNNVKIAQGKVRIKQVELEAKKALADKRIISALDFEKSNLELEQTQLALQLAAQELESFEQTRSIELNLAEIQLTKASKKLLIAKQSVQHLKVRSELDGVLIDFERDIQLGQVIKEGTVIGQVADPNSLYAELLI
uniref:HlyD family secretion protein n=1 Tax=Shewanella sp. TaxID=50422 RepID=UPI0035641284